MRKTSRWVISGASVILAVVVLLGTGFYSGFNAGRNMPREVKVNVKNIDGEPGADLAPFWEAWGLIDEKFIDASEVSAADRVRGATDGLIRSLGDPYSEFFDPEAAKRFKEDVEGNFSGIGAEIGVRKGKLVIVSPLKGSPAEKAGLRSEDHIVFINGTSTVDMGADEAVVYIRGAADTEVVLTIDREGFSAPKDFKIKRAPIAVPTLDMKMLPGGIAYVQLYSFNANAETLFYGAIRSAAAAGAKGVLLDLRGNPGGYLEVAVNLAGWFLPKGTLVVSEADRNGVRDRLRADGNAALADIPTVILIDGGSASAAEILAGALHDQRQVPLVGETTFGKGSVQEYMDLEDGSVVKLTIAHWVLPKGKILNGDGIAPDHEVKLTPEDIEAERDPQMEKGAEILRGMIK